MTLDPARKAALLAAIQPAHEDKHDEMSCPKCGYHGASAEFGCDDPEQPKLRPKKVPVPSQESDGYGDME